MKRNDALQKMRPRREGADIQDRNKTQTSRVDSAPKFSWAVILFLAPALALAAACATKKKQDDCSALYSKLSSCKKNFPVKEKDFVGLCRERHSDPVVSAQLSCNLSLDCKAFQTCLDQARTKGALIRLDKDLSRPGKRGGASDLVMRCTRLRRHLSQKQRALCEKQAQRAFDEAAAQVTKKRDRADGSNLWQVCGTLQQASALLKPEKKKAAKLLCAEAKAAPAFRAVLLSKAGSPDRKRACAEANAALEKLKSSRWAKTQVPLLLSHCMGASQGEPMMGPHLILYLNADGSMSLQGQRIKTIGELPGLLAKAHKVNPKVGIVIQDGRGASYADLVSILDKARQAGFTKFGMTNKPLIRAASRRKRQRRAR